MSYRSGEAQRGPPAGAAFRRAGGTAVVAALPGGGRTAACRHRERAVLPSATHRLPAPSDFGLGRCSYTGWRHPTCLCPSPRQALQ